MWILFRPLLAAAIAIFLTAYLSRSAYDMEMAKAMPVISGVFSDVSWDEVLREAGTGSLKYAPAWTILVRGLPPEFEGKRLSELGVSDLARTIPGKRYRYEGTDGTLRLLDWKD